MEHSLLQVMIPTSLKEFMLERKEDTGKDLTRQINEILEEAFATHYPKRRPR